jgi:hypothetical protein
MTITPHASGGDGWNVDVVVPPNNTTLTIDLLPQASTAVDLRVDRQEIVELILGGDGPMGLPGPEGGPTGPTGPSGPPGIVWHGDWDWQTDYQIGDSVSYGGVSWVAYVDPPVGETPPNHQEHWQLVADKGQQGPTGPPGPTESTSVVLTAPNASRWRLVVDNTGALSTIPV